MPVSLDDMQVFVEVVRSRSFTGAADRLNRTRSAISQTITRLEDQLGTRLLHRSTRTLSLTDVGGRFFVHCNEIENTYNSALSEIHTYRSQPAGILSVTAPNELSRIVVVPVIKSFVEHYPDIRVRLLADDSRIDLIQSQIDLALRVGAPSAQTAKVSKLGVLVDGLYASPDYIAARSGRPSDLSGLAEWDHIVSDWEGIPTCYSTEDGSTIKVIPRIRCNTFHDLKLLVESGAGVGRIADIAAAESVEIGSMIKLFDVGVSPIYSMHYFAKRSPAKISKFLQLIRSKIKSHKIS